MTDRIRGAKKAAAASDEGTATPTAAKKTARVAQTDIPRKSLREAMRVPQAIADNYAGEPTAPHEVAFALNISPTSSAWRELTGAAQAYGLVKGGYNADRISLEPLGRRSTMPQEEGDETRARAEAVLRPKIFGEFFRKYDRAKFPPDHIARNVLLQQFGVPADRGEAILDLLKDNGQYVGFIRDTKTGPFVTLENPQPVPVRIAHDEARNEVDSNGNADQAKTGNGAAPDPTPATLSQVNAMDGAPSPAPAVQQVSKVFITHGKNLDIVEQVKDILSLYDIEFEIAVEEETAAIPVPQKVMEAMRRCGAGIMVVTADEQGKIGDSYTINTNVLIEIGAAFVLYDQRVVLVWDKRLKVPSNLQGLYRLEFEGSELTFSQGTKLAKAVKSIRK